MDTSVNLSPKSQAHLSQYNEIVQATQDDLYRVAYLLTGSQSRAEALTQKVFQQAFLEVNEPGRGSLGQLLGILAREWLASERLARTPAASRPWQKPGDPALALPYALSTLPPEMRLVVVLVDMAELDYRQAARALNLSTTDVKHRLALARQAITKMILAD